VIIATLLYHGGERAERGPRAIWGLAIVPTARAERQSEDDGFEVASDQNIIAQNKMNQDMQQGVLPCDSPAREQIIQDHSSTIDLLKGVGYNDDAIVQ
jgi:hypothetical protein